MRVLDLWRRIRAGAAVLRLPTHKRRWTALVALVLLLALTLDADTVRRTPTEEAIAGDRFGLVEWMGLNLLDGAQDALFNLLPGNVPFESERRAAVERYFELGARARRIEGSLRLAVAQGGAEANPLADELQSELRALRRERDSLADLVELTIGEAVSDVMRDQGLERHWGPLRPLFPPVSFRVTRVPRLIVVSPRDRIANVESRLLESDVTPLRMEELEAAVGPAQDQSAVVTRIGGVATYPALVSDSQSFRSVVRTVAHEWLHHYFFLHPLGQAYYDSPEMASLNETAADLAGRELGDLALLALGEEPPPPPDPSPEVQSEPPEPPEFSFAAEMRETRLHTDALLAEGKVEEAEAYMEERRLLMVEHGYPIRVLNQAYFAFHGAYAESPASSSPIGAQVRRFREHSDSVGDFILRIREISTYQQFLDYLDTLPPEADAS